MHNTYYLGLSGERSLPFGLLVLNILCFFTFLWILISYLCVYRLIKLRFRILLHALNGQEEISYRDFIKHYITTQNYIFI